jgi:UDP-N-acetylmuramyl pentapeptide phosphotransferase/UDP-N-acetylglucosamine-1-phosphate transferase
VGSAFLGFTFAAIIVASDARHVRPGLLLLIPLGAFICDATYTLIRRLLRGERVYEAHKAHIYQRLVQSGWSHASVSILVGVLNVCLGAIMFCAAARPRLLPASLVAAVLVLAATARVALSRPRISKEHVGRSGDGLR